MALIKCSECGKKISDKATACPNCGAPIEEYWDYGQANPFYEAPKYTRKKFYTKTWFTAFMLICFFPIGIYLMWKYKTFNISGRIIVTALFCIGAFVAINNSTNNTVQTNQSEISTTKAKQSESPKETKESTEEIKESLLTLDTKSWGHFKNLYIAHNNLMKAIDLYANDQITSVDFYDYCTEVKGYFRKASLIFDYGTTDDEVSYLSVFKSVALSDQQAAEALIKYIDSGKTSQLSKAQENIQNAKDAFVTIAGNRGLLLAKAGLTDEEITEKVNADMAQLDSEMSQE